MATKAPIQPYKLRQMAAVVVSLEDYSVAEALRGVARWLDDHPYAVFNSVTVHYGEGEDNWIEFFIDQVEDDDL